MASLRLASFKTGGRASYGAVTDRGIVDLGRKLAKYPTLLDVFRATRSARRARPRSGAADYQLKDVTMLPPIPAPEKIICVGINYPDRSAEYKDGAVSAPKSIRTCSCAFRPRWSATGSRSCGRRSRSKFDYEGEIVLVIGQGGPQHPAGQGAVVHRRAHARQRGQRPRLAPARHAQRHPGQEFRQLRQPRPLDRAGRRRRSRQAAASHHQGQRRNCGRTTQPSA